MEKRGIGRVLQKTREHWLRKLYSLMAMPARIKSKFNTQCKHFDCLKCDTARRLRMFELSIFFSFEVNVCLATETG